MPNIRPYYDLENESDMARWLSECVCPLCGTAQDGEETPAPVRRLPELVDAPF